MHFFSDSRDTLLSPTKRSHLQRYGGALLLVVVATFLTISVPPLKHGTPFIFLFVAVTLSTWYGGLRPGLFAIILSIVSSLIWLLAPTEHWFIRDAEQIIQLGAFLVVAATLCLLVHALHQTRERFYTQREELRVTLASIGDAVIVVDLQENVSWINEVAATLTGWSVVDAVGRPLAEVLPIINEETRIRIEDPVHRVLAEGKILGLANHTVLLAKNGVERPIEDSAAPIRDETGKVSGVILVFRDVTERKQAEASVHESGRRFHQLADAMPQIVWMSNQAGRLSYLNQQWLDYTGLTLEDSLGGTYPDVHPADLPAVIATWQKSLQQGVLFEYEVRLRRHDGVYRWFLARCVPVYDATGKITQWFGTSTDIDERMRVELNRQFLSELDAQIRRLVDPDEIRSAALQALGMHLAVDRCTLNDVDADTLQVTIAHPWHQAGAPSLSGHYNLTDLVSPRLIERTRQGYTVAIADTATDPYSADRYATGYAPLGIGALVTVPCLTEGRWVALLSVHSNTPRLWQAEEVALVEAVATHIWPAIVKARTEQALRVSELELRLITDHMPGLIAYVDRTERYGFVNATYESWFGRARAQIEGSTIAENVGETFYKERQTHLQRVLAGQQITFENTSTYPDGITRTVLTTYVPSVEAEGQVGGFYVFVTDISERKEAEEVLTRYQLLSERARDIILYIQGNGQILEANQAAVAAYGYDRATLVKLHIRDLRDPATVPSVAEQMTQADMAGIRFETMHRRKDGSTFPVEVSSIGADIGGERMLLSIVRDITDRKRAEAALRESEERFRATFEQAAVGIAQINLEGRYIRVNDRICELMGYDREELLQKTYQEITHPDDLAADVAQAKRLISGEMLNYTIEKRYLRKDGTSIWTTMTRSAVRDENGIVKYGIAVIEDISAQKAAEARLVFLAEASAVLTSSLDYAITLQHVADQMVLHLADWCAVDIIGEGGAIELAAVAHVDPSKVTWARELRARYPVDMDALQGLPNVIRTGSAEFYPEITEELILRNEPNDEELAIIRQVAFKSMIIAPLQARGQVLGALTLVWSDSDRHYTEADLRFAIEVARRAALAVDNARLYQEVRQLNETLEQRVVARTIELKRSNQELDQFAYVASHDLKAPLRAIDHLAYWISEDAQAVLPPSTQEHLTKLRGRVKRLDKLLDDLLAYSRAGRIQYGQEEVQTYVMLQTLIELLAPPPGFTVTIDETVPTLTTMRVPLETVLRNLIGNAIKHHHDPNEGDVHVSAQVQEAWVTFTVTDNGPGIDPAFHDRIFQLFQTLRPRDQVEGSGIGLAVVKKMVESYGGAIQVESKIGHGTIFRFTWPIA